jgi:hypothetical protein
MGITGIMVIAESLGFQTINLVGLAKIVNKIINSVSISQTLHLANEIMMHYEATALVPAAISNLTRVSVASCYTLDFAGAER